ncbi:hypothetical protein ILUMI_18808 [Ignelater luminosus]|uniref:Regulatory protein zeste n=1 Tax=Ignelater luminosus TaxID=2038154 RepID=A0A8K0G6H7_IGNLU|nr:hypothetical protein ILUMI_18808 [Ignelater luminosus]
MESAKRPRTANFDREEVRLLVDVALNYKNIVENKCTDDVSWKAKNEAWESIAREFNSQSGSIFRTAKERKNISIRKQLLYCEKVIHKGNCSALDDLDPVVSRFCKLQLRNVGKKKNGRVYDLDDKLFALTLYKQSPKAYRTMSNFFTLPSVETLRKLLRGVPITPRVSKTIFNHLKIRVQSRRFSERNKCCALMFDEMSLQPNLFYSKYKDNVEGFEDDGVRCTSLLADHVMVWILRSIYKKWKQPVAYSFCKSSTSPPDIVRAFKDVIRSAVAAGLNVIACICDQGATNARAVRMLLEESRANALRKGKEYRNDIITADDATVIPLFDPPHLLKCIRNNLITKDLRFTVDGNTKIAKWSHIVDAYHIDVASGNLRLMPKLTELHVIPDKIKKMKVSICTQVFSRSVAAGINEFAITERHSADGKTIMSADGMDTAELLKFFDDLFDSVNGGIGYKTLGKPLRNLTRTAGYSLQKEMWDRAIPVIASMEFIPKKRSDRIKPEVLKNWILTLHGFQLIRERLSNLGFKAFAARVFNQDSAENIFCQVQHFQDTKLLLWRLDNTRYEPNHILETQRSEKISVVLGWVSSDGPGELIRIDGRMNGAQYVRIVNDILLPGILGRHEHLRPITVV